MTEQPSAKAPTGRNKPAQGKERSDAALGHASQNTSSPDGAKEGGEWPGGIGKAHQLFGEQLPKLLNELNAVLAA